MSGVKPKIDLEQDVYSLALERAARVLRTYDQVFVAFSGGKDSTAVLNVTLEAAHSDPYLERHLPLRVVFYDEEAIPQETADYVQRVTERPDVALEWYCLPVQHRNACSREHPYWWPWAPEDEALWCRPLPDRAITELAGFPVWPQSARMAIPDMNPLLLDRGKGEAAILMGIRALESLTRYRAVARRSGADNWLIPFSWAGQHGITKAYPIYDWRTEDVWTAPAVKGWDYNRAYDLMEMAGLSHTAQRCSPAFGEEPIRGLQVYAQCFPDVWEKMTARVPGVGAALRYAKTDLYGFGGTPDKPVGVTWQEYALHFIGKHPPEIRAHIRARLADEIRRHYRKTTDPICPTAAHPVSGVAWDWLVMLAMRADLKGRRVLRQVHDGEGRPLPMAWREYVRELSEVIEAGRFAELGWPGRRVPDPLSLVPEYAREAVA